MSRRAVVLFCMSLPSHYQRLRPLIGELCARGVTTHVFTNRRFAEDVESCGGHFVDLFAEHRVNDADAASYPEPLRYIAFAWHFGSEVVERVAKLDPAVVIYDSLAIVGRLVAHRLGIPYVNVCAGHDIHPARMPGLVRDMPRVGPTRECLETVRSVSEELEIAHPEPYAYLCAPSPFLNIYCEPPEFLDAGERAAFEPVAFFGSVYPARPRITAGALASFPRRAGVFKVYVSCGTANPRRWPNEFDRAIRAIGQDIGALEDSHALISLGGRPDPDGALAAAVTRVNVQVASYVDQWQALQEADVFITHHGLNSTHEAVYHRVPMLSYPFYWDQPGLARRCQQLGLALPLTDRPRDLLPAGRVRDVLARLRDERTAMKSRLDTARGWEERVIAERGAVVQRILDLG
jgi:MGT family glycosyltransferase